VSIIAVVHRSVIADDSTLHQNGLSYRSYNATGQFAFSFQLCLVIYHFTLGRSVFTPDLSENCLLTFLQSFAKFRRQRRVREQCNVELCTAFGPLT
jgi:hypothetical protein